jgi:CubicO group peptidase (beta-lactamase class C family)
MFRQSRYPVLFAAALSATAAFAQLPAAAHPEDVGFSSKRLEKTRQAYKTDVENKTIPGAVLLIVRNGKVATYDAIGFQERAAQTPMKKDSIFRVASMSKPITTVAAMILAEENKLDIGAPVGQYIPEFKDVKVGADHVSPKRPMTVQDLMRHTSGLTYGLFGNSPIDQMYRKADIFNSKSLAEMVKTVAGMPLLHQPGESWEYSVSTDVLGRVVEVVSGMDLDAFIQERIAGPLKMNDTGFWVKPAAISRLALPDQKSNLPFADPAQKPALMSGGGGMFSTAGDYARFSQMLLNGGELEGVRILGPKTIALMTSDQLPANTERHTPVAMALGPFGPTPEMGTSFGLGFAVRVDPGRNPEPGSIGDFSWGGITGTLFWVDPKEKLVTVMMTQSPQGANGFVWRQTRTMVYQALVN